MGNIKSIGFLHSSNPMCACFWYVEHGLFFTAAIGSSLIVYDCGGVPCYFSHKESAYLNTDLQQFQVALKSKKINRIYVFLSHFHLDHINGLPNLRSILISYLHTQIENYAINNNNKYISIICRNATFWDFIYLFTTNNYFDDDFNINSLESKHFDSSFTDIILGKSINNFVSIDSVGDNFISSTNLGKYKYELKIGIPSVVNNNYNNLKNALSQIKGISSTISPFNIALELKKGGSIAKQIRQVLRRIYRSTKLNNTSIILAINNSPKGKSIFLTGDYEKSFKEGDFSKKDIKTNLGNANNIILIPHHGGRSILGRDLFNTYGTNSQFYISENRTRRRNNYLSNNVFLIKIPFFGFIF